MPQKFQFHEGPIKAECGEQSTCTPLSFNSMKVRLKHIGSPSIVVFSLFQFHEGPIKALIFLITKYYKISFNSMKVRLKQGQQYELVCEKFGFNSMKVRLKQCTLHDYKPQIVFQFHEGPIKARPRWLPTYAQPCFNSMKVRLKHKRKGTRI